MSGITEISIELLSDSLWIVALALLVLIGLAVILYRRTNPPLPRYVRIILGALRIIAILALCVALMEPVLSYSRQHERPRRVALLLDRSASMGRMEDGRTRTSRVDSLLSSESFDRLREQADLTVWHFGGNIRADAAEVDETRTALGDAVYEIGQQELTESSDHWLLLSDGNSNSGRDPREAARGLTTPITVLDMAVDAGQFDVGISDLSFNPVLFVGQPSEIKLRLSWKDAEDRSLAIELLDSNRVVTTKRFRIDQQEGLGEVTLKYTPTTPGQKILRVNIPEAAGEENLTNNRRSFSVKVLKSKLLVLLASDHPDQEVGFLKRFLDQSDKYDVELLLTGNKAGNLGGRFPTRQTELNRYDLIVLHDPDPEKLGSRQELIRSYLNDKGGALWVMMGDKFSRRGPVEWFDRLLPFSTSRSSAVNYTSFSGEPQEGHLFHPSIRLADTQAGIRSVWTELPPFQALVRCDRIDPNGIILASAVLTRPAVGRYPILGYKRIGPGKVMASAALPFWTWGFVSLGFGEDDSNYGKFVEGTASWLTVSDDFDPVRVRPDKEVYHRGEIVRFDGFAFDQGFRPIPGVTGVVSLTGDDEAVLERDLISQGEGKYRADFINLTPGNYRYTATVSKDGRVLKRQDGRVVVESFSLEEFDPSGNPANLMALARLSGGQYFAFADFDRALASIDRTAVAVVQKGEIVLWNKYWLLLIIIAALALEWLLRKMNQLV